MEQGKRHIIAFIPLRSGSKTIPLKNIREIAGRPLVFWVLDAVCRCDAIETVYVSTNSEDIASVVNNYGDNKIKVITRSPETATDTASTESALLEFAKKYDCTDIVLVQATSPLLKAGHLQEGIARYRKTNADSLVSVVRQKRFLWKEQEGFSAAPQNYDPSARPRRQDWEGFLVENGAFYITSRKQLLKSSCRLSGRTAFYEMPGETYYELDDESDWRIVEALLLEKKRRACCTELAAVLRDIKLLVMDVDGVLTDAGMYYGEDGRESKKFNTRDGKGIELIRNLGIKTAFLTSEDTSIVEKRSAKLKIDFVIQGAKDKAAALRDLLKQSGMTKAETAYIGDDINDVDAMRETAFAATPADGMDVNKKVASYICAQRGGCGCVREVCDLIRGARA